MNETDIGTIAETGVALQYLKMGYDVLMPIGGGKAYDFVILKDNKFQKVQVKKATDKKGILTFNVRSSSGKSYDGTADLFGVYYQEKNRSFAIPVGEIKNSYGAIHLMPAFRKHEGQRNASDYELKAP